MDWNGTKDSHYNTNKITLTRSSATRTKVKPLNYGSWNVIRIKLTWVKSHLKGCFDSNSRPALHWYPTGYEVSFAKNSRPLWHVTLFPGFTCLCCSNVSPPWSEERKKHTGYLDWYRPGKETESPWTTCKRSSGTFLREFKLGCSYSRIQFSTAIEVLTLLEMSWHKLKLKKTPSATETAVTMRHSHLLSTKWIPRKVRLGRVTHCSAIVRFQAGIPSIR